MVNILKKTKVNIRMYLNYEWINENMYSKKFILQNVINCNI